MVGASYSASLLEQGNLILNDKEIKVPFGAYDTYPCPTYLMTRRDIKSKVPFAGLNKNKSLSMAGLLVKVALSRGITMISNSLSLKTIEQGITCLVKITSF